ncbi:MAG: hypothetical protein ACKVVT_03645 [Dehalococcoidia bacterium]
MLVFLGFVLSDQGKFADSYVRDQLGQQRITFATAERLTPEEKSWKPGSRCLIGHAGQLLETGKQAECYANYFIAFHVASGAERAGFPGETYATLGGIQATLRTDIATATSMNQAAAAATAQKRLDDATALRATAQTGETLRGLLLTSYGFSIFGDKATLAGAVCFIVAGLLALVAVAGFAHASRVGRPAKSAGGLPAFGPAPAAVQQA